MRTIGIDLAVTGQHQAVIADEMGRAMGHSLRFDTAPTDLDELLDRARAGADENEPLRVVMEPTGLSWLPVASYFVQRRVTVYLVNTQQVADLRKFYSPWQLQSLETRQLADFLAEAGADPDRVETLAVGLQAIARRAVALFGTPQGGVSPYVDYARLQDQVLRELRLLASYEAEHQTVRQRVRQLYRQLHPSRDLESIQGVGEEGAAVHVFFVNDVDRFASQKKFRGWSGMVPESDQSGDVEKKGLSITCAGPDLIKKYAYINAEVARQWDPQIAAVYHDQMVHKGNHHVQAVCACATHLLDRIRAVLRDGR